MSFSQSYSGEREDTVRAVSPNDRYAIESGSGTAEMYPIGMSYKDLAKRVRKIKEKQAEGEDLETEQSGVLDMRKAGIPDMPTLREYVEHNKTHFPRKAWCPVCTGGAAPHRAHRRVKM